MYLAGLPAWHLSPRTTVSNQIEPAIHTTILIYEDFFSFSLLLFIYITFLSSTFSFKFLQLLVHVDIIMQIFPLSFSQPLTFCLHTVTGLSSSFYNNNQQLVTLSPPLCFFFFYFGLLTHICNVIA